MEQTRPRGAACALAAVWLVLDLGSAVASAAVAPGDPPLHVQVALGGPAEWSTGRCGELVFDAERCAFGPGARRLVCVR